MSHRRPHTKSRYGCVQCKRNKTKCDEKKPCSRCARKRETCSLLKPALSPIVINAFNSEALHNGHEVDDEVMFDATLDFTETLPSCTVVERTQHGHININAVLPRSHFTSAERNHLRLMNHYGRSTCDTITNLTFVSKGGLSLWRDYVPELALEHDFLLHGLLGLSSLHLALSEPSTHHNPTVLAIHHYDLGITLYRPHLTNITVDKVDALFAFSCIVALYSFGYHRTVQSQLSPLAKMHEVLTLIRGSGVIFKSGGHWLKQGPFSAILGLQVADPTRKLSLEMEGVLAELSQRISTNITTTAQSDIYAAAIATLRHNFLLVTKRPFAKMTIVLFPIMVPPEFLVLLCIGEPLALAILANYAVILHWLRGSIWLERWGKDVVDAVHKALPLDWRECIAWAVREIRSGSDEV